VSRHIDVKRTVKRAALSVGRRLADADLGHRRVVFCYHSVHPNRPYPSTTPSLFEEHIGWLRAHCRVTSLDDLVAEAGTGPTVAITFDDGYEDNHTYALPILERFGVAATFFVTTGFIDRDPRVVARFGRLWACSTDDLLPLTWSQVRELRDGGMTIGAHTRTHRNLARLPARDVEEELAIPVDVLGDRLGVSADLLAYPFGKPRVHVTSATEMLAERAGYRLAAAVTFRGVPNPVPRYSLPRFFADGDDLAKLEAKIRGDYDPIGWWQQRAPVPIMRMVSPDDFGR
jgi:peptidoglycan/xylan/chitin deacetylase (PgdA/CDA1 family)